MINYKIVNDNGAKSVVETKTGQTIKIGLDESAAKSLCRHLNFGGGFDGQTPAFFLAKTEKYVFWSEEPV
jgi:hypothetical protein